MNLIVFTPACVKSAIGRMTALVTRELSAQGYQITVVRTEAKNWLTTDVHDFGTRVLSWEDKAEVRALIRRADAGIYQIGDNFEFHEGAIHWLAEFPGLVCLHDFYLGHLFYGWAQSRRAKADDVLRAWYDDEIANQFFSFSNSEDFIAGTRDHSPMTEWVCSMAQGVITHSGWGCERVLNSCPGPVRVVPLAYDAPGASVSGGLSQPTDSETLQILTIGHINPNKRVESVIQAIGDSPLLKQRVTYRLVGHAEPETISSLSTLAKKLDVRLVISGSVDDADLSQAIMESNIISCLRWPNLESASASAIEAMLYGKPIIVTDTGFYSELPESCVFKISHENEVSDLKSILELLLTDRNRIDIIGEKGYQWASQTFTAENYALRLVNAVEDTIKARPTLNAINYFSNAMHQWSASTELLCTEETIGPLRIFENRAPIDD